MAHQAPIKNLRSKEAADYLGVQDSTLRKSRVTGLLLGRQGPVFMKMGRTVIYSVSALDEWLAGGIHQHITQKPKVEGE